MRGKDANPVVEWAVQGITPAYAGKSSFVPALDGISQDHPRVCGEKGTAMPTEAVTMGSPPRMRGKEWQKPLTR